MHTATKERAAFIDPLADYGEVEADLGTIEAWGRANGVVAVDGRIRVADVAFARSKVGLPRYRLIVGRVLDGAASEDDDTIEVETAELVAWAKEIKLTINRGESIIGQVNAARASLGLPRMKVRRKGGSAVPTSLHQQPEPTRVVPVAASQSPPEQVKNLQPNQPTVLGAVGAISVDASFSPPSSTVSRPPIATTEGDLIDLVSDYSGTITGTVTADVAGWLLALNTNNRPMSPRAIDRFIKILQRGAWVETGEPIIVSREAILNEGQHRLTAIKRSGIAAVCDVRFGIAREAFAVTGTGARRTTGNAMAIAGKPHASMQAAIGRLIVQHDAGYTHRANIQVDPDLVIAAAEAEPAIGAIAALIRGLKFKPVRTAPFGFALVLAVRATSMDQATAFARLVDSGRAEEDDATRRLNVRLRDAAMAKERITQLDVAILTIRAWNAWITGRPIQRLLVGDADRAEGGFPKVVSGG